MSVHGRPLRFGLIAGESSGDVLASSLIAQLRVRYPDAMFAGIGGPLMKSAGMDCWANADELALMGFSEVVTHLPRLLALRSRIRQQMLDWRPDVFIGIDAPDFNLPVEQWLKERGLTTVHYVSPSVWAWRENRAAKIGRSADLVLCLFPMEPQIYAQYGVPARFVGHPLADEMPLQADVTGARERLGLGVHERVLALLPGSRSSEVGKLAPIFLDAALQVLQSYPQLRIVVPMATPAVAEQLRSLLQAHPKAPILEPRVLCVNRQAQTVMIAADVILLASGTAALEAMMAKKPMVVAHRIAATTYAIVKGFGMLKTEVYSLPNILAGKPIVPELMQDDCTPDRIAGALLQALRDTAQFERETLPVMTEIHSSLKRSASVQAASAIAELLESPHKP